MANQYDEYNITKCTCGTSVKSHQMQEHITRGIYNNNVKLKKNDTILNPTIIIKSITFNNCLTCEVYIDSKQYKKHLTSNCIYTTVALPLSYLKDRIRCRCN